MGQLGTLAVQIPIRAIILTPLLVVLAAVAVRIARRDGFFDRARRATRVDEGDASDLSRVYQYVRWSMRSDLGRRDLVGRLRSTEQNLYRCTAPTDEEIARDEAALKSLIAVPEGESGPNASHRVLQQLDRILADWESRIDRRPAGGNNG